MRISIWKGVVVIGYVCSPFWKVLRKPFCKIYIHKHTNTYKGFILKFRMTLQDKRLYKINWIMLKLRSQGVAGLSYNEEKLIAECCRFFGATKRYVLEYLNELELTNEILRIDGKLYSSQFFNSDGSVKEEVFNEEVPKEITQTEIDKAFEKEDLDNDKILEEKL